MNKDVYILYILERPLHEVSKKVQHTPYLLKTAEKNIFQI